MNNKLILTDVDGVLLDWESTFVEWCHHHGYTLYEETLIDGNFVGKVTDRLGSPNKDEVIRKFCDSSAIGFLEPLRDSKYILPEIHKLGYKFFAITSVSGCPFTYKARKENLERHFPGVWEGLVCLDTGIDKYNYLEKYWKDTGLYWIEDSIKNAAAGGSVGLKPILMEHDYNKKYMGPSIACWEDFMGVLEDGY